MRTKRFLLVTAALSAATATAACGKNSAERDSETLPLPANPKGSFYDADLVPPPPDAGASEPPKPSVDAGPAPTPTPIPPPANPKGSHYDAGIKKPKLDF